MKLLATFLIVFIAQVSFAQFPPPAGQPGSTAMYSDSSAFKAWASGCVVDIGYVNFVDTTVTFQGSNRASYGFPEDATGTPDNFVISLGDRGVATLTSDYLIYDGEGPDFAVFENAFSDEFLELGFVEVSSDGQHFVRFPAVSLTPEDPQVVTFGTLDATMIHNFAGKYRLFYGTPFDLSDLKDSAGINLDAITHIRIADVGGCVDSGFQSFDYQAHVINDPWPTPFNTSGFDLDAVGIIHRVLALPEYNRTLSIRISPNPAHNMLSIDHLPVPSASLTVRDLMGKTWLSGLQVRKSTKINVSDFPAGVYVAIFTLQDGRTGITKFIKQ